MTKVVGVWAFVGFLLVLGPFFGTGAWAQRFPYEAPQAPEFDDQGNHVTSDSTEKPRKRVKRSRMRPKAPQAPRTASSHPSRQWSAPRETPASATRSYRPQPEPEPEPEPQPQPQQLPDCSQFPGMIATAQSPNQMRWYARQYLTCLLKRGWRMAQAKQEVIRIIEASRRRGR